MEIPTYILFVLGCLGAADIALFHSVAHGIRSHRDSVGELVTHSLRGPTYATLFLLIPNFEMRGLFAWGLMALFVFDVGISIWDFSLEQGSRRFLGGLPSGEYILHMLMAVVFGALVATILCFGHHWFNAPTRLVYRPAGVHIALRFALSIMAIGVLASGIQDAAAALRLRKLGRAQSSRCDPPKSPHRERRVVVSANPGVSLPKNTAWMRVVLAAGGTYNLAWGARVILFPSALFRWLGMPPTNYPQIWQCVGMLVGVYGIGYLVAARNPLRHWPIILVGLIGKILGPVGMWWSVAVAGFPAIMAWLCVPNDVIWWIPFAVIVGSAFVKQRQTEVSGVHAL